MTGNSGQLIKKTIEISKANKKKKKDWSKPGMIDLKINETMGFGGPYTDGGVSPSDKS